MSIKMFLKFCIFKEILVEIKTNCRETMEKRNLKEERKKEKTLK